MDTQEQNVQRPVCPHCARAGLIHDLTCPNRRIPIPLPGVPGQRFFVTQKAVLDALARVLDGRSVGDIGEEFVGTIVEATLAQASQSGVRIEIRDSTVQLLCATDIKGASSISANISGLAQSGHEEVAKALKEVTEAVTRCVEIAAAERSELLELLDELSRQATLPRSQQAKPSLIKGILRGLGAGLGAAGGLADVWSTWGPTIQAFFEV